MDLEVLMNPHPQPEEDETTWTIPLFVKDAAGSKPPSVIVMSTRELVVPKPGPLYFLNAESRSTSASSRFSSCGGSTRSRG